mmetsp:Transcript_66357/g.209790  ORF Transcript_66357/g.209790 Transcript_66357/m.209790 type:complete len:369 (-) Transcript_66357:422-1528(-)
MLHAALKSRLRALSPCVPRQPQGTREQMQHGYGGEDRKLHQATMFLKGCYDPLKDVVVPPYNIQYKKQAQLYYADWKLPGPDGKGGVWGKGAEGRRHTFMFAGRLRPDLHYSQGIRHEVFKHLKHTPGFEVAERLPNAMQSMMQSKYCGVFTGHGWGIRISQVSANGCIPVVIQDWVTQPLEEVVPFWSFALRFSRQQIKDLPRLLGEVGTPAHADPRLRPRCAGLACACAAPLLTRRGARGHRFPSPGCAPCRCSSSATTTYSAGTRTRARHTSTRCSCCAGRRSTGAGTVRCPWAKNSPLSGRGGVLAARKLLGTTLSRESASRGLCRLCRGVPQERDRLGLPERAGCLRGQAWYTFQNIERPGKL